MTLKKSNKEKKCTRCGEVKYLKDFHKDKTTKDGIYASCIICKRKWEKTYRNTERGYLAGIYKDMGKNHQCYYTFEEFREAFKKHKEKYGMKSAWGPGPDQLDQHLPITLLAKRSEEGHVVTASNLSVDRLDSALDYTLQNIIFIRCDENRRKNNSSYEDCKIQIRLHEERFIKMKSI